MTHQQETYVVGFLFLKTNPTLHTPFPAPLVACSWISVLPQPQRTSSSPSAGPPGPQIQMYFGLSTWIPVYTRNKHQKEMYVSHSVTVSDWGDGLVRGVPGHTDKLSYISVERVFINPMTLYSLSSLCTRVVPTSFQDLDPFLLEVASCFMTAQPSQRHHVSLPGIFSSSIPSVFFSLNKQTKTAILWNVSKNVASSQNEQTLPGRASHRAAFGAKPTLSVCILTLFSFLWVILCEFESHRSLQSYKDQQLIIRKSRPPSPKRMAILRINFFPQICFSC